VLAPSERLVLLRPPSLWNDDRPGIEPAVLRQTPLLRPESLFSAAAVEPSGSPKLRHPERVSERASGDRSATAPLRTTSLSLRERGSPKLRQPLESAVERDASAAEPRESGGAARHPDRSPSARVAVPE
jgi:hypothetical protein